MTTLQSNGYQIGLVAVMHGTIRCEVKYGHLFTYRSRTGKQNAESFKLPDGFELLGPGLSTLCSEEDAAKVVHEANKMCGGKFYNYQKKANVCNSRVESLFSLIRSHSMKPDNVVIVYKKL